MPRFLQFRDIVIAGIEAAWPDEVASSTDLEQRLQPVYERLRLPAGRLELMTGIRERRVWPAGMLPGEQSIRTGNALLDRVGIAREKIGLMVHGSVCRDFLEPATAAGVHRGLGLSHDCLIYDVSNACLGLLNGVVQIASAIMAGQIEAGLVLGTEQSRPLMETTIAALNRDTSLTREQIKLAIASLTIGSGSAGLLVTHRDLFPNAPRLTSGAATAGTEYHQLCHSGRDESVANGMAPLMTTDSEQLMHAGIKLGAETFAAWCQHNRWQANDIQKTVCHQVGLTHRKLMLQSLGLDAARDYHTVEWLGNTGSTALPITLAEAIHTNHITAGDRVALLGIGSGINVLMLSLEF